MSDEVDTSLIEAITVAYGSLSEPSYGFVTERLAALPYAGLIDRLSTSFDIQETTDANDDVSFRYVITGHANRWALNLSMVGPYALLMRLPAGTTGEVIDATAAELSAEETEIIELLNRDGIQLVSRGLLERKIPLRRPGEDDGQTRVYHALISDEPLLPWDTAG